MKKSSILVSFIFIFFSSLNPYVQAMQTTYSDGTPTGYLPNGLSIYRDYDNAQMDYEMMIKHPKAYKKLYEDFEKNMPKLYINKFKPMEPTTNWIDSNQQDINNAIKDITNGENKW